MSDDLTPGRVVSYEGELYMLEDVRVEVVMQKLQHFGANADIFDNNQCLPVPNPIFTRVRGRLSDPQIAGIRVCLPAGEHSQ